MKHAVPDSYLRSLSLQISVYFQRLKGRGRRNKESTHQVHAVHIQQNLCLVLLESLVRVVEDLLIVAYCIRGGDEARGVNETQRDSAVVALNDRNLRRWTSSGA